MARQAECKVSGRAVGWWIQYRLLRRTIHRQGHFQIMNMLLPVLRRIEALRPPPFGLSLVAVLERPEDQTVPAAPRVAF